MIIVISILNKLSKFLVKRLSKKIETEIWVKIVKNFDINFSFDIKYQWNDGCQINYDIITKNQLSFEDDLKIIELVNEVEKKYSGIDIQIILCTKEEYKEQAE